MIMLTRLNGLSMAVNSDLIKSIEDSPDTVITLITGEKILVRESTEDVISRIVCFRRATLSAGRLGACISHLYHLSALQSGKDSEDR